jgi:hypothetical protein
MKTEREKLIERAIALRNEINQHFLDAAHWNESNPQEKQIHPDPHGKLRGIKSGIDRMLEKESLRGNDEYRVATVEETRTGART